MYYFIVKGLLTPNFYVICMTDPGQFLIGPDQQVRPINVQIMKH